MYIWICILCTFGCIIYICVHGMCLCSCIMYMCVCIICKWGCIGLFKKAAWWVSGSVVSTLPLQHWSPRFKYGQGQHLRLMGNLFWFQVPIGIIVIIVNDGKLCTALYKWIKNRISVYIKYCAYVCIICANVYVEVFLMWMYNVSVPIYCIIWNTWQIIYMKLQIQMFNFFFGT